ncbi:IPT/TIG domain-containing protein [Luethyella okanaganae]|uniref:IPT/TIG domain-containing protein n=1 Tax=Luethyella okanaganae TaxID=69372 RepID=A0ABW1VCS8_9MICO
MGLFASGGIYVAQAAPGDSSHAEGQFLSGSLIDLNTALVASLGGETATSDGTSDVTNANNLDLGVLGLVNINVPGGIQIPLNLADAGVVSQYASALANGSSVGASGLVSDSGDIGTGITPAPGVAPGPLHLSLGQVVGSLGLPPTTLAELANLELSVDAVAGRASQAAPAAASGSYDIADAQLSFDSPTVANLVGAINTQVAGLQTTVDGLDATLTSALSGLLSSLGVVSVNLSVSAPNLAATISGLTTGPLADPAYPGVTLDLATGTVTVDLDQITALNGLPANTDILTDATINTITDRVLGLVTGLLTNVEAALLSAVDGITVQGSASLLGLDILTLDTTVGALLAGDTSGLVLLGTGLTLPGGLGTVLAALTPPLTALTDAIGALSGTVLAPVTSTLIPALKPVLNEVLTLTVNNQSTAAGVFTETALRVTVLPLVDALELDLGTARVGPNALDPASSISSLSPTSGPVVGGTVVTITGTGFTGATGVTFDGLAGTAFTVNSDTQITVTSPPHAVGPVNVIVLDPNGDSAPATFTYIAAAAITGLSPTSGPVVGGTVVTITGTGFTGATGVTFDGLAGTAFTVNSDTQITVTSPPHAVGPVNVIVLDPNGDSAPATFTYLPAAAITGLTPSEGPETGGTVVTITGTGFTGATGVTFDGLAGTAFTVNSDTQITVTSPPHTPSVVDVIVTSPNGDSAPQGFSYLPVPALSSLSPTSGPEAGGTVVTITGTGFTGATGATFGGVAGSAFTVVNDTTITVTSPPGTGTVDVVVTGPGGTSGPLPFTYIPAPTISSIVPPSGPETGGTVVTITGTGFTGATGATFGGVAGSAFTVVNDTTITVTTPVHAPGAVAVIVTGPGGSSAPGTFTFTPVTRVDGVDPGSGPVGGGNTVTISGQCFTGATSVTFGGVPATSFTVVDDATITAVVPAGVGVVDIQVVGGGTCGTGTLPGGYEYLPAPDATSLTPDHGPETGGTVVTIIGTGFTGATGVTFGGAPGTGFVVVSDTEIRVTSPAHAPGVVDVVVAGPGGVSDPLPFLYDAVTVVDTVDPGTGPEAGGTTVTITGRCFTGATAVRFGDKSALSFTVVSDTVITAVSPAGTGIVPVTIVGAGACGTGTLPGAFAYKASGGLAATGVDGALAAVLGAFVLLIGGVGVLLVRRGRLSS